MKNVFSVATVLSLTMVQSAYAVSTGSILLSGTVAPINEIVITENSANTMSLNIGAGEAAKNIASVVESSNNAAGYKILMSSVNAGELRHTLDATKKTTYRVSYDGGTYTAPGSTLSPVVVKNVSSASGLATHTSQVLVNVTALASALAGNYQDTLTLTIQAN